MKRFLSPKRQKQLILDLTATGMPLSTANKYATLEDDMNEVDLAILAHAQCVVHFRNLGSEEGEKGLICIRAIMYEAMERGYSETDFPLSHEFIKNDVKRIRREVQ